MDEIYDGQIVGDINATAMSGCQVEPGIVGNSIYFDGVSAWADLGNQRHRWVRTEGGTEYSEKLDISVSTRTNKWNFKNSRAWMDGEIYSKNWSELLMWYLVYTSDLKGRCYLFLAAEQDTLFAVGPTVTFRVANLISPLVLWQRVNI